jgi:hypothetical protein
MDWNLDSMVLRGDHCQDPNQTGHRVGVAVLSRMDWNLDSMVALGDRRRNPDLALV